MVAMNVVISQAEGSIVSDMDGEKVMLSIQNGKYYNLGEVGGEIWEYVKEPIPIIQLIRTLVTQYDVEERECSVQVIQYINHLAEEGLVKVESP